MKRLRDRVYFSEGSPWPQGHAVKAAYLDGSLYGPDRLDLNLHLETVDYCQNDGGTFDDNGSDTDWGSKVVWNNYHRFCVYGCVLAGATGRPASVAAFADATFVIDPLPEAYQRFLDDELAFTTYLLGHDAVADHRISFGQADQFGYPVHWQAKIALSYSGDLEFRHSFEVHTHARLLEEIHVRCDCSDAEAQQMLADLLTEASLFKLDPSSPWRQFIRNR